MKKMPKIVAAVSENDDEISDLFGYQDISDRLILDVKLCDNFLRKARFVADGRKTDNPSYVTYSTVVSRDLVRICLKIVALKNLYIVSDDIENTYLTAPC